MDESCDQDVGASLTSGLSGSGALMVASSQSGSVGVAVSSSCQVGAGSGSLVVSAGKSMPQVTAQRILYVQQPSDGNAGTITLASGSGELLSSSSGGQSSPLITKFVSVPASAMAGSSLSSSGKLVLKSSSSILSTASTSCAPTVSASIQASGSGQITTAGQQYFPISIISSKSARLEAIGSATMSSSANATLLSCSTTSTGACSLPSADEVTATCAGKEMTVMTGMSQCARCGSVGVRDSFYGRGKQFCSLACSKGAVAASGSQASTTIATSNQIIKLLTIKPTGADGVEHPTQMVLSVPVQSSNSGANAQSQSITAQQMKKLDSASSMSPSIISVSQASNLAGASAGKIMAASGGGGATSRFITLNHTGRSGGGKITTKSLPLTAGRIVAATSCATSGAGVSATNTQPLLINTMVAAAQSSNAGAGGTITLPISATALQILKNQANAQAIFGNQDTCGQSSVPQSNSGNTCVLATTPTCSSTSSSTMKQGALKRSYSKVSISTSSGVAQEIAVVNTPITTSMASSVGSASGSAASSVATPTKRMKRTSTSSTGTTSSGGSLSGCKKSKAKTSCATSLNPAAESTNTMASGTSREAAAAVSSSPAVVSMSSSSGTAVLSSPIVNSSLVKTINTCAQPILLNPSATGGPTLISTSKTLATAAGTAANASSILISQLLRNAKATQAVASSCSPCVVSDSTNTATPSSGANCTPEMLPLAAFASGDGSGGGSGPSGAINTPNATAVFVQINTAGQAGGAAVINVSNQHQLQQIQAALQKSAAASGGRSTANLVRLNTPNAASEISLVNSRLQQVLQVSAALAGVTPSVALARASRTSTTPTSAAIKSLALPASLMQSGSSIVTAAPSKDYAVSSGSSIAKATVLGTLATNQSAISGATITTPSVALIKPQVASSFKVVNTAAAAAASAPEANAPPPVVAVAKPTTPPLPPPSRAQEMKAMDISVRNAMNNALNVKNLNLLGPPVWWLIFDKYALGWKRCAPISAFCHFPVRKEWADLMGETHIFELKLIEGEQTGSTGPHNYFSSPASTNGDCSGRQSPSVAANGNGLGVNGGKQNGGAKRKGVSGGSDGSLPSSATNTSNASPLASNSLGTTGADESKHDPSTCFFWFVRVVAIAGCYLRLRYVGLESNPTHDFWVNLRLRNIYPSGYAKSQGYKFKLPKVVQQLTSSSMEAMLAVKQKLSSGKHIGVHLYSSFCQSIQATWMKRDLKLEAQDKAKAACYRPATVDQLIGDRIHVRYDGDGPVTPGAEDTHGLWTHLQAGQLRPIGWSQLVGHELYACDAYSEMSLQRALNSVRQHISEGHRSAKHWGVLTTAESYDQMMMYFREGMKLEAIDPFNQLSVCVVSLRRVLRFGFLLLAVDNHLDDPKETAVFCAHASSPYLLPAGFCKVNGIPLQAPLGYKREFNWAEYCMLTESVMAPIDIFPPQRANNEFAEGMLLEAVDILEPNLICVAVVRRVVEHLLLLHFIGWEDSLDQWCDCRSPNIFPVGYCDLVQYPLQGPPCKDGTPTTPNKTSNSRKSSRSKRKSGSTSSKTLLDASLLPHERRQQDLQTCRKIQHLQEIGVQKETEKGETNNAEASTLGSNASDHSIMEFNFTANMSDFGSVPVSTRENSRYHNSTDDLFEENACARQTRNLLIRLHDGNKIALGRKPSYEDDDDIHCTSQPMMETLQIGDQHFEAQFRYYDDHNDFDYSPPHKQHHHTDYAESCYEMQTSCFVSEQDWHLLPKCELHHVKLDLKNVGKLPEWTPAQVGKYLQLVGFAEFSDRAIEMKITGRDLLLLKESTALRLTYSSPGAKRLMYMVEKLRDKFKQWRALISGAANSADTLSGLSAISLSNQVDLLKRIGRNFY